MKRRMILLSLAAVFLLFTVAGSQGGYTLPGFAIGAGGGRCSGGAYVLVGTIGQPDAGAMVGGAYALSGGLLAGGGPQYSRYVPIVIK